MISRRIPALLGRALRRALRKEPDLRVVPVRLGDGGGGLRHVHVLLVSLGPGTGEEASLLGRAWNAWRASRVVLLDLPALTSEPDHLQNEESIQLTEPCRRAIVSAIRDVQSSRYPWAPRLEVRLEPTGGKAVTAISSPLPAPTPMAAIIA